LSKRVCVKSCPSYGSSNTLPNLLCYTTPKTASCAYTITILPNGSFSGTPNSNSFIGYDSSDQIGRVCIPSLTPIKNALA